MIKPWLVDLPDPEMIGEIDSNWVWVGSFVTKEEAVAWIRENVGPCDDDGRIGLITWCPQNNEEVPPS